MNILVILGDKLEAETMTQLIKRAGLQACAFTFFAAYDKLVGKPTIKALREHKVKLDAIVKKNHYDCIFAAGETAARLVLDTSAVNINKLRGRDFEYEFGVKSSKKKMDEERPE